MRFATKVTVTLTLLGAPLLFAAGCAPVGSGNSPMPAAAAPLSVVQPAMAQTANWERAATMLAWPQFGYDPGHSGYNPLEKTLKTGNVSALQTAWDNSSIIQPRGIVVSGPTVYIADQDQATGSVFALSAANGKQRWATNVGLSGSWGSFEGVPAVSGNVVLTPCSNQSASNFRTGLCGLKAKSGKIIWSDLCSTSAGGCGGLPNHGTSPTVYNGLAYFQMTNSPNEQPDIYGVDPQSGNVVWDVGGSYLFHCPDAGGPINPLPAADGHVFAVLPCQTKGTQIVTKICALSASSGAAAWCTVSQSAYVDRLVEGEGKVFASEDIGSGTSIVAMNEKTGNVLWKSTSLPHNVGGIAVADHRVFVNYYFTLYALSVQTGKSLWTQTQDTAAGTASVANGVVYTNTFGGNNGDHAIAALNEKTGAIIWASSAGNGASPATPVIVNGTVYAGCYTVCAFTLKAKR
ncbi:MAG TPA: PQQ-binding-like beta-propeller repeat protein [Candidatus Tumulicola sp.]|jgi:outer membrane protein assembly factor BamB